MKIFFPFKQIFFLCCFLIFLLTLNAQAIVTGKVISKTDGTPVSNAAILIKGTTAGTITNSAGMFSIKVPAGKISLIISVIGYQTETVSITDKKNIEVALIQTSSTLNDVVVTGYTSQKKKDITGSVSVVNVSALKQQPAGTVESALQGMAAGVTIINSGQPGSGSNVRIRGITSLGDVDPLIIVDGVPGDLHDLNLNDIASIQVLKDAGAASIYGVRGSNGVIVITTKKGKAGDTKVEYEGYYGTQRPLKNGFDIATPQEIANAIWQQQLNSGIAHPKSPQYGRADMPVLPDYLTPTGAVEGAPGTDPADYNINSNQITKANKSGTDWFHAIFVPASTQSHSLSVSKASDKSNFYFSLSYLNQQGTLIETYLKRYGIRLNNEFNIKKNIRIGENLYAFYKQNPTVENQNEYNAISYAFQENPIIPVYDIMGNFAGTKSRGLGNSENPYADQYRTLGDRDYNWQVEGNVYAEVDLLKHFTARTSFGGTSNNYYYYSFSPTKYENAEGNTSPNSYTEGSGFYTSWTWTNTLKYVNNIGKHNITILGGSEAIQDYSRGIFPSRGSYTFTDPNYVQLATGSPLNQSANGSIPYKTALFSYLED